ncbi:hypothetical protein MASR1M68_02280 [Elusimicrobiota bacterium]
MKTELIQNLPNASKLVYSLRHLDYNNLTALSDLVDNSLDANATKIWVDIMSDHSNNEDGSDVSTIIISDNGKGMDKNTLDEALKLGSNIDKNASCDLGYYGMGLITASISMGSRLKVITKTVAGEYLSSVQDLDLIHEKNEFIKTLEISDKEDIEQFEKNVIQRQKDSTNSKEQIINSGTVVIIDKIDNCNWKKVKGLADNLQSHFSKVYRKFLKAEKVKIFIQDKKVEPIDPIFDFEPNILCEEYIKYEEGDIKVLIAELKDCGATINKDKGINVANQGFYVLRNNREIIAGETLGIFSKHNDYNTLRIEFSYPGTLDSLLSSNFSKNRIVLNQSLKDKLEKICNPFIKQVRKNAKVRQTSDRDLEDFSEIEKFITQKSHLLKMPQVEVEERDQKNYKNEEKIKRDIVEHGPRLNIQKRKRIDIESLKAKFGLKKLGEKGPLYDVDQEREKVIIYWNEEHPFYLNFVSPNGDNPDILNPISFLVYSLATAELISKPDSDSEEILQNIRFDVGRNLAILLK